MVTLEIVQLPDAETEVNETVTVAVAPETGYRTGTLSGAPDGATVTIVNSAVGVARDLRALRVGRSGTFSPAQAVFDLRGRTLPGVAGASRHETVGHGVYLTVHRDEKGTMLATRQLMFAR
jgi:hypothetical protein